MPTHFLVGSYLGLTLSQLFTFSFAYKEFPEPPKCGPYLLAFPEVPVCWQKADTLTGNYQAVFWCTESVLH